MQTSATEYSIPEKATGILEVGRKVRTAGTKDLKLGRVMRTMLEDRWVQFLIFKLSTYSKLREKPRKAETRQSGVRLTAHRTYGR